MPSPSIFSEAIGQDVSLPGLPNFTVKYMCKMKKVKKKKTNEVQSTSPEAGPQNDSTQTKTNGI